MANLTHESLDDLFDRYKAKVWTYAKSCSRSDRIFLLIVLVLIPPAWSGLIYWSIKQPTTSSMSFGQGFGFVLALLLTLGITFFPIIARFGALLELVEHILCALVALPPLWIIQQCRRAFSILSLLAVSLSGVCTVRERRHWDKISSSDAPLCKECRRIVTKSTILNGSILGLAYPIEKYRHLSLTTLTSSAQQCHLCNLYLNSALQCWRTELGSGTTEKEMPELQVELKAVKIPKEGTTVFLKLHCMGIPGYVTLAVDEIHKSKSKRLWPESVADISRRRSYSNRK